ncbi:MAG: hypothetical protein IKV16_06830 [Clostridia bacterium]|nr:hypothetical protein [Clostridia bacterium]
MGFGTLFIGYFLLLNLTYFAYTDLLSGLIMLMGLYKLSTVNKPFKYAFYSAGVFSVFGAAELIISFIKIFAPLFEEGAVLQYVTPIRYIIIGVLSVYTMIAIRDVSAEVGLKVLRAKAGTYAYVSAIICALATVFDLPILDFIPRKPLAAMSITILLAMFIIIAVELSIIYKAYMRICMPSELGYNGEERKSKYQFVNKFREHEAAKHKEYAEYKLNKMISKSNKKKKKGKKR